SVSTESELAVTIVEQPCRSCSTIAWMDRNVENPVGVPEYGIQNLKEIPVIIQTQGQFRVKRVDIVMTFESELLNRILFSQNSSLHSRITLHTHRDLQP
ncbi:MAG: hypothetical protein RL220_890, partial [Bacteroidota bacterium]